MARDIATMLMFTGRAEEAIVLYTSLFPDSGADFVQHYGPETPGHEGEVVHARFHLDGRPFMAMDDAAEQSFSFTPSVSIFVTCDDTAEVDRLAAVLGDGGSFLMPLGEYPFAKKYAWVQDRFGVSWQLTAR